MGVSRSGYPDHREHFLDYKKFDDLSLMRSIARGATDALGELYDRYGRLVFSVALNAVGDHATAEEIAQDVFTRAWEKSGTYDENISKVSTWLISITRNRSIDELRRGMVRADLHAMKWEDAISYSSGAADGPEEVTELVLEQLAVRKAVAVLPEDQRMTIALAYFKGYTHSEIAKILDEPLGTVKTRIRLAMQKIRQILAEQVADAR
jgi:RNA polymerase sigma-70 factor (ECF subfamily)